MDNNDLAPENFESEEVTDDSMDLSIANQRYLQENFRTKSLEELCVATMLPPDIVASYLDAFETEARKRGIDPHQHFALSVTLNEENNVGFGIQFPSEQNLENSIEGIGHLLFALNEGSLKGHLVQFLQAFGEQRQAHELVHRILKIWSDLVVEKAGKNRPIISADEVFK